MNIINGIITMLSNHFKKCHNKVSRKKIHAIITKGIKK